MNTQSVKETAEYKGYVIEKADPWAVKLWDYHYSFYQLGDEKLNFGTTIEHCQKQIDELIAE